MWQQRPRELETIIPFRLSPPNANPFKNSHQKNRRGLEGAVLGQVMSIIQQSQQELQKVAPKIERMQESCSSPNLCPTEQENTSSWGTPKVLWMFDQISRYPGLIKTNCETSRSGLGTWAPLSWVGQGKKEASGKALNTALNFLRQWELLQ